jgi:hypothetical protein
MLWRRSLQASLLLWSVSSAQRLDQRAKAAVMSADESGLLSRGLSGEKAGEAFCGRPGHRGQRGMDSGR